MANQLNIHEFTFDKKTIPNFVFKLSNLNTTIEINPEYGSCVLGDKKFSTGRVYWEIEIIDKGLQLPFGIAGQDFKYSIGHYFG